MSRRTRTALLLVGVLIAALSAILLLITFAPRGNPIVERARIAPTAFIAP
jgi:hypothetical protein